jgi:hypothetical protein
MTAYFTGEQEHKESVTKDRPTWGLTALGLRRRAPAHVTIILRSLVTSKRSGTSKVLDDFSNSVWDTCDVCSLQLQQL